MKLVAGIAIADPDLSLRDIAAQLDQMRGPPARGGRKWQPSSVRALVDEAVASGSFALESLVNEPTELPETCQPVVSTKEPFNSEIRLDPPP
ncbi:hypothetical protein GGE12_004163 [Rhizobium mongolense]|uniref:Recombinase domain-containing protein n=1 Tax=Rhizobium mongolense TaxID=57676 RepID=A0A7W6WFL5_9HYPH|nr:hypothetical protein [Rhizobium mongolense]